MSNHSIKFIDLISSFRVILLTDKQTKWQTDTGKNITSFTEVMTFSWRSIYTNQTDGQVTHSCHAAWHCPLFPPHQMNYQPLQCTHAVDVCADTLVNVSHAEIFTHCKTTRL